MYLTYSGDPVFAKEYVDELKISTIGKSESEALTLAKETYKRIYHDHFVTVPDEEKLYAEMIMTLHEGDSVSLYSVNQLPYISLTTITSAYIKHCGLPLRWLRN